MVLKRINVLLFGAFLILIFLPNGFGFVPCCPQRCNYNIDGRWAPAVYFDVQSTYKFVCFDADVHINRFCVKKDYEENQPLDSYCTERALEPGRWVVYLRLDPPLPDGTNLSVNWRLSPPSGPLDDGGWEPIGPFCENYRAGDPHDCPKDARPIPIDCSVVVDSNTEDPVLVSCTSTPF